MLYEVITALERLDQLLRGERLEQSRHVLDRQDVSSHPLEFLGQLDVVREGILVALRVEDVAGVSYNFV